MHHHPSQPHAGHGHSHDQGAFAFLRYLRLLPVMWRSPVSAAVVAAIAPQRGERVVDLGAGMGAATVEALGSGASVVAVDPTPYMRGILSLRRRWPGRKTMTVLAGAAESIPAPDASIDALWTVNTLHHWTDRTAAARELARTLRPGGRALLLDEDFDDPKHPLHDQAKRRQGKHAHTFDEVDVEMLAAALRSAGFTSAEGTRTTFAGRPAKVVRAVR